MNKLFDFLSKGKLFIAILIGVTALSAEEIVFHDMKEHRQKWIEKITSNPRNVEPYYPIDRVLLTIKADDSDYIPKVPDAGKIFEENGVRYQLMHNGVKILENSYYGVQWMTDIISTLRGHHEPQEEKAFYEVMKHIPPNSTMIELGSYWAYYSLWFNTKIPGAKNYMIEPLLGNLQLGKKHFDLNGREGSFVLGYVRVTSADDVAYAGGKRIIIDDFIKENQIDHVNILHADIQWAEYAMLLTCKESIKKQLIDYFFISTHDPLVHLNCRNFLLESNYLIISEHKVQESCSVDGLIVARRKNISGPKYIPLKRYP